MGCMGESGMNEDYRKRFEMGDKYEDFVYPILCKEWGVNITPHKTKNEQLRGENSFGVEIKYDSKSTTSPNIFIEYAECREIITEKNGKREIELTEFKPSGIYRGDYYRDNSWLYLIGNYDIFYIFLKKRLKDSHSSGKYREVYGYSANNNPTSKGFLLPQVEAKILALDIINITNTSNKCEQNDFDYLQAIPEHI
jgi:hypothetical protein